MAPEKEETRPSFTQEDHQVAYIFDPENDEADLQLQQQARPTKRRRVSKKHAKVDEDDAAAKRPLFQALFDGKESEDCVRRREEMFGRYWGEVDEKIQDVLQNSNNATLEEVGEFTRDAALHCVDQIPCALIMTGPNIASQDLLFSQLSSSLTGSTDSRYVRLLSSECSSLKATLKKIIRDATMEKNDEGDEIQGTAGRRYLDYDLDALYAHVKANGCEHVYVAFQDSEGFDSGLLSELVQLLHSWRPRIPFTLLFGIATSVDLLQARLLKSSCSLIYGAQFDVVQTGAILEAVFKAAVAGTDVAIKLGPHVLREMLDRQHDQVAGIQAFTSSLKYAYMCHFYANPLSILTTGSEEELGLLHPHHIESLRNLPSFRNHVEGLVETGEPDSLERAKGLLHDDELLRAEAGAIAARQAQWRQQLSRALTIVEAGMTQTGLYSDAFVDALARGIHIEDDSHLISSIQRKTADELSSFLLKLDGIIRDGEDNYSDEGEVANLSQGIYDELVILQKEAGQVGHTLRSKYSGQSKIIRTTVIAQKVQLSQDKAALRDEDQRFTAIVDKTTELVKSHIHIPPISHVLFSETWVYDSKSPLREVFVPRPRLVFERSLSQPHDYLACSCCSSKRGDNEEDGTAGRDGGVQATMPATSILYHLYKETGSLINVADLWSAFYNLVEEQVGKDERKALVLFYKGLAELRSLGYVKGSRKKTDHVAKVKWL